MKVVAIYTRKSKQTDKGESIETQINLCKDYINRIFSDEEIEIKLYNEGEGFSGGDSERKKFNELIRDAKSKKYNVLICYRLDRVARSVADFSDLIEELNDNKISFISVKEQFDTSTPMRSCYDVYSFCVCTIRKGNWSRKSQRQYERISKKWKMARRNYTNWI